jgi:Tfp pilus assembly protein PilF
MWELTRAIQTNPDYDEAYKNRGMVLRHVGLLEAAETDSRRALAINPHYADALNELGTLLSQSGRLIEAEKCFRLALLAVPTMSGRKPILGL